MATVLLLMGVQILLSTNIMHSQLVEQCLFPRMTKELEKINDWEFHYNGWTNPGPSHRHGATTANMFPEEMDGCLDADVLKKMGLNKRRMHDTDAFFFFAAYFAYLQSCKIWY